MPIEFKRELSTFITDFFAERAALNSRVYNTEIAVEFQLSDNSILPYATTGLTIDSLSEGTISVSITPKNFTARLSGSPDMRHTQTRSPDIGKFNLVNLDYLLSSAISTEQRIYDNTRITVYLCFPKESGNYEGLVYFKGILRDIAGDDEFAEAGIMSDIDNRSGMLGKEITQRCVNEFTDSWCGVPASTVPAGAICSKVWHDATAGCKYWGGVYNGVPNSLLQGFTYLGVTQGGGWSLTDFPDDCPDVRSFFKSANGGVIKGKDLKRGENLIDYLGRVVTVEQAEVVWSDFRYLVTSRFGAKIIVSAKHRFIAFNGDEKGTAAVEYKYDKNGLLIDTPTGLKICEPFVPAEYAANYHFKPTVSGEVIKLSTTAPYIYGAAMDAEHGFFQNHNQKPIYAGIQV